MKYLLLKIKIDWMKALIVDDESAARDTLRAYLTKYCPDVDILGEAADVPQAVEAIHQLKPQLVFLDVEMPFGNAFDVLEHIEEDKTVANTILT